MRSTTLLGALAAAFLVLGALPATADDYRQVKGVLRYQDVSQGTLIPIRYVQVKVLPILPNHTKTVTTGADGSFSAVFPAWLLPPGSKAKIEFKARNHAAEVYVDLDSGSQWLTWSRSATVPIGTGPVVVDATVYSSNLSAQFNIADGIRRGRMYGESYRGDSDAIVKAKVEYPSEKWSQHDPNSHVMRISGAPYTTPYGTYGGDAEHGFWDFAILHEYGHHLTQDISAHDGGGGAHALWTNKGYEFAWCEGFATYYANAVAAQFGGVDFSGGDVNVEPIFMFTQEDLENGAPSWYSVGSLYPAASEAMTQASLWDLHDAANEPHDVVAGNYTTRKTIFQIFDLEIDQAATQNGTGIQRTILGFHEAWRLRRGAAADAAFDRVLFAHGIFPHVKQDYWIASVTASKSSYASDEAIGVTVKPARASALYGAMPVKVRIQLVGASGTYTLATVDWIPTAATTIQVSGVPPQAVGYGSYWVRAVVDADDRVDELTESNNKKDSASKIQIAGLFDALE